MNLFTLKRALLAPYVWYMRHKYRGAPASGLAMLEAHYYRPTMFRWMRKYLEDPSLVYDVPLDPSSVVVDAGAFTGDWSAEIVAKYDANMYLFEPNPACFPSLSERFSGNAKVHCFDYGLHSANAVLPLTQAAMGSSVFPESIVSETTRTDVRLRDVVEVLDELGCGSLDLLKLNIEGGEYEVLESLIAAGRLASIRCLLVQFHEWRDGAYLRRWRIQRELGKTHELDWDYPFVWEKWTRRD